MREVKESKKWEKKRRGERKEGKDVAFVRKMRTAHFRGDACKMRFCFAWVKWKTKRKRAGEAQDASAFSFFACLRGKPNPLRCCFTIFPRRVARERGSPFPRKFTPFRLRCAPCGTVVPLKVTLGKSAILPRFIKLYFVTWLYSVEIKTQTSLNAL